MTRGVREKSCRHGVLEVMHDLRIHLQRTLRRMTVRQRARIQKVQKFPFRDLPPRTRICLLARAHLRRTRRSTPVWRVTRGATSMRRASKNDCATSMRRASKKDWYGECWASCIILVIRQNGLYRSTPTHTHSLSHTHACLAPSLPHSLPHPLPPSHLTLHLVPSYLSPFAPSDPDLPPNITPLFMTVSAEPPHAPSTHAYTSSSRWGKGGREEGRVCVCVPQRVHD